MALAAPLWGLGVVNYLAERLSGGYPFRMFPAYLLILVTGIPALFRLARRCTPPGRPRSAGGWILGSLALLLGLVFFGLSLVVPLAIPMRTLDPSGPYPVGTVTYEWTVTDRVDLYAGAPNTPRRLAVQFWYPLDGASGEGVAGGKGGRHSSREASYPVVVFSHGATGIRSSNTSTYREFASHGYIVGSIDHTYLNLFTRFSDGHVALISQRYLAALNGALEGEASTEGEMLYMYRVRVGDMCFPPTSSRRSTRAAQRNSPPAAWIWGASASSGIRLGRLPQPKPAGRTAAARPPCCWTAPWCSIF